MQTEALTMATALNKQPKNVSRSTPYLNYFIIPLLHYSVVNVIFLVHY